MADHHPCSTRRRGVIFGKHTSTKLGSLQHAARQMLQKAGSVVWQQPHHELRYATGKSAVLPHGIVARRAAVWRGCREPLQTRRLHQQDERLCKHSSQPLCFPWSLAASYWLLLPMNLHGQKAQKLVNSSNLVQRY